MQLTLEPDPAAVHAARAFVTRECGSAGLSDDACHTAALLTSEAVTNAFTHGRSEARIVVLPESGGVRVEVGDDNSRHPQPQEQDSDALDGRGLAILDLLAARWGVRDTDIGKVVWFEVADS